MKMTEAVKRYRTVMDIHAKLGQVMTPQPMADALLRLLGSAGGNWLELGSGSGRLAEAVYDGAAPLSYIGVELEAAMIDLCPKLPGFQYVKHNVLAAASLARSLGEQQFDHVIGNPPYGMHDLPPQARKRLLKLCPDLEVQFAWASIDLYFVLESLARLKSTGTGAFIVGTDIPCGVQSRPFRKMLVDQASEIECYELPSTAFGSAVEVHAYMMIVRFGRSRAKHVSLGRVDEHFEVVSLRRFDRNLAIESMDLSHHEFGEMNEVLRRSSHGVTMRDLGVSIIRGSRTRSQFSQLGIAHFHTSDFPKSGMEISLESESVPDYQQATVGDILLPRVGTRCLEHKAVVVSGQSPYSESVFRIRTPAQHQGRVVRWITSDECTSWRRAAARGACAKHLTVSALLGMPVLA
jgi:hypothetical protein